MDALTVNHRDSIISLAESTKHDPDDTYRKTLLPTTRVTRVTLCLSLIQTLLVVSLEIISVVKLYTDSSFLLHGDGTDDKMNYFTILINSSISVVGSIFALVLCWDSVVNKNVFQILAFTAFNFVLLVYSVFELTEYAQLWQLFITSPAPSNIRFAEADLNYLNMEHRILRLSLCAITGFASVSYIALSWECYLEFRWTNFKRIGANIQMQKMYKEKLKLLTLLKLDTFFFIAYLVQSAVIAVPINPDSIVNSWLRIFIGIPLSVLMVSIAVYAEKQEKKYLMIFFLIMLFSSAIYLLTELTLIIKAIYQFSRLNFYIVVTVVFTIFTLIQGLICLRQYGRGLRAHLEKYRDENERRNSVRRRSRIVSLEPNDREKQLNENRWSIE